MTTTQPRTGSPPRPDRRWSPSPTPLEGQQETCACQLSTAAAETKAPRRRKGRTMNDIVTRHPGPDGKVGFTFRDLCPTLHVAAESLRAAIINPGRLSVEAVVALAGLMHEDPMVLLADILAETRNNAAARAAAERKARKAKTSPKATVTTESTDG